MVDDPFSCFGEGDSDSSTSEEDQSVNNETIDGSYAISVSNVERGRRLLIENTLRKENALINHAPMKSPDYEVFDDKARGRGMGVRALRSFVEGEEIMREGATMRVPGRQHASTREEAEYIFSSRVQDTFNALSQASAQAVMDLSSCEKYLEPSLHGGNNTIKTPPGIYQTNSFQLGDEVDGGLFLTISRINHSCRPNANHIWRPDLQKTLIQAARKIEKGEDICTSYGPSECLDTCCRRSYLREKYSFECQCEMCTEGNDYGGDDRMVELNALFEDISFCHACNDLESAIQAVDRGLLLLDKQGLGSGSYVKPVLQKGYEISLTGMNDIELARSYLTRELVAVINSEGVGSYRSIDTRRLLDALEMNLI